MFGNIIEMFKIGTFQRNLFLKVLNIYFVLKNILECWNCNVAMKYFAIFDENVATIFQLQWNIENIPDMFLQYSVLCGYISKCTQKALQCTQKNLKNVPKKRYSPSKKMEKLKNVAKKYFGFARKK